MSLNKPVTNDIVEATDVSDIEMAYLAGFFDGEGSVGIATYKRRSKRNYKVYATMGNTDKSVVDLFHRVFGGTVSHQIARGIGKCEWWQWSVADKKAYAFVERIRPFLRVKHTQAWLAMEFHNQKKGVIGVSLSDEERALRLGYYLAMQELKHGS